MASSNVDETVQENALDSSNQNSNVQILPGGPFVTSCWIFQLVYQASCFGLSLWYRALDYFLSRFISTTESQKQTKFTWFASKILHLFLLVLSFGFVIVFAPFGLISFFIWFPLQLCRPRAFSYLSTSFNYSDSTKMCSNETDICCQSVVVSGNVCLMPEFVARINNLSNTPKRAEKIAANICNSLINKSNSKSNNFVDTEFSESNVVTDVFPENVDFLCFQEVFDSRSTKNLIDGLSKSYPFIIYDVAWPIHNKRMVFLNSGLCIASRYPFIDIQFQAFPNGHRDDKLAFKGLLMTKIYLSKTKNGSWLVGYLSTTHLQAWSSVSTSKVRRKQLDLIENWINTFKQSAKTSDKNPEIVMFNVITGDFNFDQISSCDSDEQHSTFMQNVCDPCVNNTHATRALHSWVVGTELNQKKLHDDAVRTPQGLQSVLVSDSDRHCYVMSTNSKSSSQKVGDGKRKIDYIVYKQCENVSMYVNEFKFFSGLAGLTDHIPIGMSFTCRGLV